MPGGSGAAGAVLSARGTRLNKKGRETRRQVLREAVLCLSEGTPESVSANAIAQRAGVTWGTIQHQFGDVDGLWAALLDFVAGHADLRTIATPDHPDIADRVEAVIDMLWGFLDLPGAAAIYQLRLSLPHQAAQLEESYPQTARAIAHWDVEWTDLCERCFRGLGLPADRLMRVRHFLPGALRGLYNERNLSTYTDSHEARRGLMDALSAYLSS
ncbi:TetR/AcrR family transcriptional regulator [Nocardioides caeni]|uniref:TetR/AcrR family transcriptional regulator n=1 Tax=Nocardioides caeni TaxID=574700 RepID=A0A4S8NNN7_9ACTN|nr:TetR/AcrR family transcriptional regulator [Nocardioides caeni]THV18195.1 TetR/AcrR family transcriptional regulator [Nocardioides caeni]